MHQKPLCCSTDATGRWAGKQFSIVPLKEGRALDAYLDKQVRSNALVSSLSAHSTRHAAAGADHKGTSSTRADQQHKG